MPNKELDDYLDELKAKGIVPTDLEPVGIFDWLLKKLANHAGRIKKLEADVWSLKKKV